MTRPVTEYRMTLAAALRQWRDAGAPTEDVTDLIEGLIAVKVDEILQARADNARSGVSATGDGK